MGATTLAHVQMGRPIPRYSNHPKRETSLLFNDDEIVVLLPDPRGVQESTDTMLVMPRPPARRVSTTADSRREFVPNTLMPIHSPLADYRQALRIIVANIIMRDTERTAFIAAAVASQDESQNDGAAS